MTSTPDSAHALCTGMMPTLVSASQSCTDDAMLVFDGSGSMAEVDFTLLVERRIFAAHRAVHDAVPNIAPVRPSGLVIYGTGKTFACGHIDTRFGPRSRAAEPVIDAVHRLQPSGGKAVTVSVARAADALDYRLPASAIALLTDRKETCGGLICQWIAELDAGAFDLAIHVIGFKVRGDHFGWHQEDGFGYGRCVTIAKSLAEVMGCFYSSIENPEAGRLALSRLRDTCKGRRRLPHGLCAFRQTTRAKTRSAACQSRAGCTQPPQARGW